MSLAKNIAQIGASFIPGVGPIASAALGAIGGSGKQGSTNTNQKFNQTENIDMTNTVDMFDEAVEDPRFAEGRNALMPMFFQQMRKAQQPVYGDPQKAQFLQSLNELGEGAISSLKSSLASTGRLNSGSFDYGLGEIGKEKVGKATEFFGNLPFMEKQAQFEQTMPLMNLGASWFGRAPISQRRTGTTTERGTRTSEGTSTGNQTMQGPSFLSNLTNNLAGAMNQTQQGKLPSLADTFKSKTYTPPSAWYAPGGLLTDFRPKGFK